MRYCTAVQLIPFTSILLLLLQFLFQKLHPPSPLSLMVADIVVWGTTWHLHLPEKHLCCTERKGMGKKTEVWNQIVHTYRNWLFLKRPRLDSLPAYISLILLQKCIFITQSSLLMTAQIFCQCEAIQTLGLAVFPVKDQVEAFDT